MDLKTAAVFADPVLVAIIIYYVINIHESCIFGTV